MALEEFRSHGAGTIEDAIRIIPAGAKNFLKQSFVVLASLDRSKWPDVIAAAAETFESGYNSELEAVSKLKVSSAEAKHLMNSASFTAAMIAAHPECTAAEFKDALLKYDILQADHSEAIFDFAQLVSTGREGLTEEIEKSALRNEVLPSLDRIETTVDVRLSIGSAGVVRAVPVALMMIDTDGEGQVVWCQVSKQELKAVIGKLEKTLERMEVAEKWIDKKNAQE